MDDLTYFEMRMRQEREAAKTAQSSHARGFHDELASAYDLRCRFLRKQNRLIQAQRVQDALESQSF
jgi:hypothetical protein